MSLAPWVIMFGVFWFLFVRPQKQKQQQHQEMLSNLERGDKIITIGGIKGMITELRDNDLEIKIAPEVKIDITRNAIRGLDKQEVTKGAEE